MKDKEVLKEIAGLIKRSTTIFISGHLRPDGDTVGSQLALASLLKKLKKKSVIYNADPIPKNLRFLPGVENINIKKSCSKKFDLAIILECMDAGRMGNIIDIKIQAKSTINIDHHLSYSNYADINYVDKNSSSTAEMVWNLFKFLGEEPDSSEAMCLYAGILTDTGCFQHSNTSEKVFSMASSLVAKGVDTAWMHEQIYQQRPLKSVRFIAYVLNNFKLYLQDMVAVIALPQGRFNDCAKDSEEIISYLLMTDSVRVGIYIRQVKNEVRASFRSKGNINVAKVAEHFGGGGHRNAAGMSLYCGMNKGINQILEQVKKVL